MILNSCRRRGSRSAPIPRFLAILQYIFCAFVSVIKIKVIYNLQIKRLCVIRPWKLQHHVIIRAWNLQNCFFNKWMLQHSAIITQISRHFLLELGNCSFILLKPVHYSRGLLTYGCCGTVLLIQYMGVITQCHYYLAPWHCGGCFSSILL